MKNNKIFTVFLFLAVLAGLSTVHAAPVTTFDLNLSNLNTAFGKTYTDIENILATEFSGSVELFLDDPDAGDFRESSVNIAMSQYNSGSGWATIFKFLDFAQFQVVFTDITGDYDDSNGQIEISFDPGQTVSLYYLDAGNPTGAAVAEFEIGPGSGGFVVDTNNNPIMQTYYLTLVSDTYGLFDFPSMKFEASLIATNFVGAGYTLNGQMSAVPLPGSLILLGSGLLMVLRHGRRDI